MADEWVKQLEQVLWPTTKGRDVWMILDGARDKRIFEMLLDCHLEYACLYSGTLPSALTLAAPYLVRLENDYQATQLFLRRAWGNSWGVLFQCDQSLRVVRRHLRELLIVRDPAGEQLLFRYYDPRVLRVYLPTCSLLELSAVFGPLERFWVEDEEPETLLEFQVVNGRLVTAKRQVGAHELESEASTRTQS